MKSKGGLLDFTFGLMLTRGVSDTTLLTAFAPRGKLRTKFGVDPVAFIYIVSLI